MRPVLGAPRAAALALAGLLAACGGKDEAPAPRPSHQAPAGSVPLVSASHVGIAGSVVYDGSPTAAVRGAILRGKDYYNLQFLLANGLILDVLAGMATPTSGAFDVAWSGLKSSEMAGHAALMVSGVPNGGSPRDARGRVSITVFADGDSVRATGRDIGLENGARVSFDVTSCTDEEVCPID